MAEKGQVSIEFMYITAFLLLILTIYSGFLLKEYAALQGERNAEQVKEVARMIAGEINTAWSSGDGYESRFYLPGKINGRDYSIVLSQDKSMIEVRAGEDSYAEYLTARNLDVLRWNKGGEQTVSRENGRVVVS